MSIAAFPDRSHDDADESQAKRLHANRLASMGELAAGVAHEVNNPAAFVAANTAMIGEHADALSTVIKLLREVVQHEAPLAKKVERILAAYDIDDVLEDINDIVNENLDGMGRITSIVRDLRTFSRVEVPSECRVHPNAAVNSACSLVNNKVRHRAVLVKELKEAPMVVGDPGRITQILTNLLINAAQSIPEADARDHSVKIGTEHRGDVVVFSVTDDGPGIPNDVLPRIFEPFFTTKADGEGTGLGLALAREIARSYGGDVTVRSTSSAGTTFELTLLVSSQLDQRPPPALVPPRPVATTRARALVVDDDPLVLKAYGRSLKKSYDVVFASSGQEAIDLLAFDDDFDVVICDLMMPRVSGEEVFRRACATAPQLARRFVFVSGGVFTERGRRFVEAINNAVLEKPVAWSELYETVARIVSPENE